MLHFAKVCAEAEGQVLIFMLFLALYIYLRSLTDSLKSRETTAAAAAAEAATKQGKRGLSSPSTLSNSRESLTVLHYFYYMVVMD